MIDQLKTDGHPNRNWGNHQNDKNSPKYQWKEVEDHGLFREKLTVVTSIVNQNIVGMEIKPRRTVLADDSRS